MSIISLGTLAIIAIVLFIIGCIITAVLYNFDKIDTWEIGVGISVFVCFLPLVLCLLELAPEADGVNIEKEILEENVYDITSVEQVKGYDCIYVYHTGSENAIRYPKGFLTDNDSSARQLVLNDDSFSNVIVERYEEITYSKDMLFDITIYRTDKVNTVYIYTTSDIVNKYADTTILWQKSE